MTIPENCFFYSPCHESSTILSIMENPPECNLNINIDQIESALLPPPCSTTIEKTKNVFNELNTETTNDNFENTNDSFNDDSNFKTFDSFLDYMNEGMIDEKVQNESASFISAHQKTILNPLSPVSIEENKGKNHPTLTQTHSDHAYYSTTQPRLKRNSASSLSGTKSIHAIASASTAHIPVQEIMDKINAGASEAEIRKEYNISDKALKELFRLKQWPKWRDDKKKKTRCKLPPLFFAKRSV